MKQEIDKIKKQINIDLIYQNLPNTIKNENVGFVAGSWVAAEIFKQLKLNINPVANDIDWFIDLKNTIVTSLDHPSIFYQEIKNVSDRRLINSFGTRKINGIYVGENKMLAQSCETKKEIFFTGDYGIVNTAYKGIYRIISSKRIDEDINVVNVSFYDTDLNYFGKKIEKLINNFDINAIQIGFDVREKELYGSEFFWKFCITLQLEITKAFTPAHSIIRYLKKKRELGCYGDDDFNAKLCGSAINQYKESRRFGKEMHKKALVEEKQLKKLGFKIIQESIKYKKYSFSSAEGEILDLEADLYSLHYTKEKKIIESLYDVYGPEKIEKPKIKKGYSNFTNALKILNYGNNIELPIGFFSPTQLWSIANLVWRGSIKQKAFFKQHFKKVASDFVSKEKEWEKITKERESITGNDDFFMNRRNIIDRKRHHTLKVYFNAPEWFIDQRNRHEKMVNPLSTISTHGDTFLCLVTRFCKGSDDFIFIEKFIKAIEKEFGPIGVGVIESSTKETNRSVNFFDSKNCPTMDELKKEKYNRAFSYIRREIKKLEKCMVKKLFEDQLINNVFIRDLVSAKELREEGDKQHHCVGGYARLVQSKKVRIFSAQKQNNPSITFEMVPIEINKEIVCFEVKQSKISFNNEPDNIWLKESLKSFAKATGVLIFDNRVATKTERKKYKEIKLVEKSLKKRGRDFEEIEF